MAPTRQFSPARLRLALLDPQVGGEVGFIAADLLDEALGVLAAKSSSWMLRDLLLYGSSHMNAQPVIECAASLQT